MDRSTALRLSELNTGFYEDFGDEFAATRHAINPGIQRALEAIDRLGLVLDLGCGDGRVGRHLARADSLTAYRGVDGSSTLLAKARESESLPTDSAWIELDLTEVDWVERLKSESDHPGFDTLLLLAVLHHLPGARLRGRLLDQLRGLAAPGATLVISVWQPSRSARLADRIVPWSELGLDPAALESGDLLLDWRRGGRGLRYVHEFTEPELLDLCRDAGWKPKESFRSDGQEGELGLYVLAEPFR